jgi:hypothetical protein
MTTTVDSNLIILARVYQRTPEALDGDAGQFLEYSEKAAAQRVGVTEMKLAEERHSLEMVRSMGHQLGAEHRRGLRRDEDGRIKRYDDLEDEDLEEHPEEQPEQRADAQTRREREAEQRRADAEEETRQAERATEQQSDEPETQPPRRPYPGRRSR